MAWLIALGALTVLPVLYLVGLRNEQEVRREWVLLLTPKGEAAYEKMRGSLEDELQVLDVVYGRASAIRQAGSVDQAVRILDAGYGLIAEFSPNVTRLLAGMAVFSRMVSAMAPLPPLRPSEFRLRQLATIAGAQAVIHRLLVSTAERFRWRTFVLSRSLGLALRYLFRSTKDREWDGIEAAQRDVRTLTEESLETFRVLLVSLTAERRK